MLAKDIPAWPKHLLRVTISIDGIDTGRWDKFSGGGTKAEPKMYRGGGSLVQRPLPALKEAEPWEFTRGFHPDRDDLAFYERVSGNGVIVVSFQPLGTDQVTYGNPVVKTGVVGDYTPPEGDVDDDEPSEVSIVAVLAGS